MTENKTLQFSAIKGRIIEALENKKEELGINESVSILDGFVNQTFTTELTSDYVIGGPRVPIVMLIGNKTGRVYYFALKAILTDLEI
jgi:hypothetical protein